MWTLVSYCLSRQKYSNLYSDTLDGSRPHNTQGHVDCYKHTRASQFYQQLDYDRYPIDWVPLRIGMRSGQGVGHSVTCPRIRPLATL
jgi:hypothetical protein